MNKRCYTCRYRSCVTFSCDYILVEHSPRGCSPECCDKYKAREVERIHDSDITFLYISGLSDRGIARQLQVSRYVPYSWRMALGLPPIGKRGRPTKKSPTRG